MQKNNKKNGGTDLAGCFSVVLTLSGIFMAISGTIGFIYGLFGQDMHIKGRNMGLVDLPTYIGLLIIAIIMFGSGYGIDFLQRRRLSKKQRSDVIKMGYDPAKRPNNPEK